MKRRLSHNGIVILHNRIISMILPFTSGNAKSLKSPIMASFTPSSGSVYMHAILCVDNSDLVLGEMSRLFLAGP